MPINQLTIFTSRFKPFFFQKSFYQFSFWIDWPEGMTHSAWQWLLKITFWFVGNKGKPKSKSSKGSSKWSEQCIRRKNESRLRAEELIQKRISDEIKSLKTQESSSDPKITLDLITVLKLFWERKHMSQHIEDMIPDYRNQDLITYSKQSIIMSALTIFLLRMGSGNKYDDKSHDKDEKYSKTNIAKFIDAPKNRAPVIKTIEKFLKNLGEESINNLMFAFFKDLQKSKFFSQHPQIMPGDFFLLAADCVHTHTYDHLHHSDINGNNDCECCLKRVYNKGTEKETVRWLHNTLVMSFVFFGGLKIPIYRYPIHAKQVVNLESDSEHNHKQECELVALKTALPIIREAFPIMNIVLLLDGLYANKPVIRLADEHRCGYIIVRKEDCLSLLAKECDEHASFSNHKKNGVKKCRGIDNDNWIIEQKYSWFNSMYLGDNVSTNVLRFHETRTREGEEIRIYKCEWLFSWRLSAKTCELAARQARTRWEIEDIFNTLKNRGFNLKHDYSRNPRSCFNWHGIALLAFGIFELFRFSEVVKQRGDLPQSTLAEKLLGQLLHKTTDELFSESHLSKRIQFRYHFVIELVKSIEVPLKHNEDLLDTG